MHDIVDDILEQIVIIHGVKDLQYIHAQVA